MSLVAAGARPRAAANRPQVHRRLLLGLVLALAGVAWAALWGWSVSPYARYLEHGPIDGPLGALCRALPAGGILVPALLSAIAWILMTLAMMLPTTLPLFDAFDRLVAGRVERRRLLLLLALGYVSIWGSFGVLAHGLHAALLTAIDRVPALARDPAMIGAATIALAGAFQFSSLKHRCLDKCRTPLSFVIEHWRGRADARQAFTLGVHHGLFCVGCCWALMLLMFVVGMGNLGWMLVLATVMAIEKNLPWGRRLSAPLGAALLAWAGVLVLA